MPRQVDYYPRNWKAKNDPTQQLTTDLTQVVGDQSKPLDQLKQVLALLPQEITDFLNKILETLGLPTSGQGKLAEEIEADLEKVKTWFDGMWQLLNLTDFTHPDWTLEDAMIKWVEDLFLPTGLIGAIGDAIDQLARNILDAILKALGLPPVDQNDPTPIETWFNNMWALLNGADFTHPDWTVAQEMARWVEDLFLPTGKLAALVNNLINAIHIPGLDATKIISGFFHPNQIPPIDLGSQGDNGFWHDLQDLANNIVGAFMGDDSNDKTIVEHARIAMDQIFASLTDVSNKVQSYESIAGGAGNSGTAANEDFSQYPDGPLQNFTVFYSGAGTSTIGVVNGATQMNLRRDGSRQWRARHDVETETTWQAVRSTVINGPVAPAVSYLMGRVSPDGQSYCFIRIRNTSLWTYKADMGYVLNGVETIWRSDAAVPAATTSRFDCGVGANERQFQFLVGNTLIIDYTEPGTASPLYKGWGFGANTDGNQQPSSGKQLSGADAAPPTTVGSGATMTRRATSNAAYPGASTFTMIPAAFFDTIAYTSSDIIPNSQSGRLQVTKDGWYQVEACIKLSAAPQARCMCGIYLNGQKTAYGNWPYSPLSLTGSWIMYMVNGDYVQLGACHDGNGSQNTMTGEASGTETRFSIALLNKSYA